MAAPNELSFLPDDYLDRKQRRRTNAICAVLFCVVIAAIGSAFWVTERSMRDIDQQAAMVDQQYNEAAKRIEQVQELQEKQRTMAHQAELTASLLEKVPRSRVLAAITNGLPPGISLLDFTLDAKIITAAQVAPKTAFDIRKAEIDGTKGLPGLATAQPRAYDVSLKATGIAENDGQVSQFITKLNQTMLDQTALLKDVNLVFTDEYKDGQKDGPKLRKFQIEMSLNPDANIDGTNQQHNAIKTASASLEAK
jgi:Tfp pilus assembly protein PilN